MSFAVSLSGMRVSMRSVIRAAASLKPEEESFFFRTLQQFQSRAHEGPFAFQTTLPAKDGLTAIIVATGSCSIHLVHRLPLFEDLILLFGSRSSKSRVLFILLSDARFILPFRVVRRQEKGRL